MWFGAALVLFCTAAMATEVSGTATVIDGDTMSVRGQLIRLHGIDAPESKQTCVRNGAPWDCGRDSAVYLNHLIHAQPVLCEQTDMDRYGRVVAVCKIGGIDLNAEMVRAGFALAFRKYSLDYVEDEDDARQAKRGLWSGQFDPPWVWRAHGEPPSDPSCPIKGNIGKGGKRLYHVPGDHNYSRAKIDPNKGERWFCSEAEAEAAGWRRVAP